MLDIWINSQIYKYLVSELNSCQISSVISKKYFKSQNVSQFLSLPRVLLDCVCVGAVKQCGC